MIQGPNLSGPYLPGPILPHQHFPEALFAGARFADRGVPSTLSGQISWLFKFSDKRFKNVQWPPNDQPLVFYHPVLLLDVISESKGKTTFIKYHGWFHAFTKYHVWLHALLSGIRRRYPRSSCCCSLGQAVTFEATKSSVSPQISARLPWAEQQFVGMLINCLSSW